MLDMMKLLGKSTYMSELDYLLVSHRASCDGRRASMGIWTRGCWRPRKFGFRLPRYKCGRVGDLKLQSRVCFAGLLPLQVVGCVGNEGGIPWVLGAER